MAVIHVLDSHTAELIAAGEVVERPASAAKELLENAVDAGATQITLAIEKGGISLIQVTDNGSGIESEYIAKAFLRHATSKISCEKDLDSIHTLGFRGEALASIASVSRVEVLTCTEEDEFACRYRIEGGRELGMEADARPVGTTISVRDLFYNTPARMKFLKKDSSEGTFVGETVSRIALSHPEVAFTFLRDGKVQFRTPGDGRLQSAVYTVLGRSFAQGLLPVAGSQGAYQVSGLITSPAECRASRGMQFFYLNGRFIKSRTMMAALENAYKGTLMQGRFPGCVLMLEMPAELVDVNVHPAKTEVRFAREGDVFDAIYRAVKATVALPSSGERHFSFEDDKQAAEQDANDSASTFKVSLQDKPDNVKQINISEKSASALPYVPVSKISAVGPALSTTNSEEKNDSSLSALPGKAGMSQHSVPDMQCPVPDSWADTFRSEPPELTRTGEPDRDFLLDIIPSALPAAPLSGSDTPDTVPISSETENPSSAVEISPASESSASSSRQLTLEPEAGREHLQYVGEIFRTYIVTQRGDELCLIDKHAAHERLIYEQIAATYGHVSSQMLLVPIQVNLSAEEKTAVLDNLSLLEDAGLELEDFGGSTVLLRAVPADVVAEDAESLVIELAAKLARGGKDALSEKTEWVLHSISCRAAMKAGDKNQEEALLLLAETVLSGKIPPFCPHGRPIVLKLTRKELEKQFGRLG